MKELFKYLGWVLFFASLWFGGCTKDKNPPITDKANTPKIEAKFEPKTPIHEPIKIKAAKTIILKGDTVFAENPINPKLIAENEKLKANFAKETDSLKRVIAYNKSVELNRFSTKFEDTNLILNIDGIVQGEVKEITPNYTIKEKEQPRQKETVFRLLGGFEVGNTTQLDNFAVKGNLLFQNRKGNIISGSVDTNQMIYIGYNWSIFNIKR